MTGLRNQIARIVDEAIVDAHRNRADLEDVCRHADRILALLHHEAILAAIDAEPELPGEIPEWAEYERLRAEVLNAEAALGEACDDPGAFTAEERDAAYERAEAAVAALDAFVLRLLAERREPMGYAVGVARQDGVPLMLSSAVMLTPESARTLCEGSTSVPFALHRLPEGEP